MRRPGSTSLIVVLVILFLLIGAVAAPVLLVGTFLGGSIDKATGSSGPRGSTCYMEDSGFSDLSISTNIDTVIEKLRSEPRRAAQIDRLKTETPDAEDFKYYLNQIIEKGVERSINPTIAISIWWGEQEFLHPEKAFGFKYFDSGTAKDVLTGTTEERWQKQLSGVYAVIEDAVNNTGSYTEPIGEKTLTRLFFNYATAMQDQYKESFGVWSQSYNSPEFGNPYYKRFNIIKLLNPDLVTCINLGGIGIASGNFSCPVDINIADNGAKGGWGDLLKNGGNYRIGTYPGHEGYDLMAPIGSNIYSASSGKVASVSVDNDGDGQSSTSVTVEENSNTYWYYTHLQKPTVSQGDTVKRGDKIAEVGEYIRDDGEIINHLHLGISKRLNNRPTNGSQYNWEAWYYPYEFLQHISCLQPPTASEVSYP